MNAIARNARALRSAVAPSVKMMAVVKANAYGHGDTGVARTALVCGYDWLAVALTQEAERLRSGGITAPILILGAPDPETLDAAVSLGVTQTVFTPEHVRLMDRAAERLDIIACVHLKIDTGMGRIGSSARELPQLIAQVQGAPRVKVTGAFTHLSSADGDTGEDDAYTLSQIEAFTRAAALVREAFPGAMIHASNSAGMLRYPNAAFDCVRAGIALYGAPPVASGVPLEQAMTWVTRVSHVKEIPPGGCVSYGRTFQANEPTVVATIPVGYADGYHRALSNRGEVLIRGMRAKIIGRVCMDQFMVDVTGIPGAAAGDEAVLMGRQGAGIITAAELGAWAGTISYEMFCAPSARVPREVLPYVD